MPQGQPLVVPRDGLTTRQRRQRQLVIVHTGEGKGKSTAAFGLALRGWSAGWRIGVFQFGKSAKWRGGEGKALRQAGAGWVKVGEGWARVQRYITGSGEAARRGGCSSSATWWAS